MGAVTNPGLYPVDPTVTVADALALAGGATARGDQNKIRILRNGVEITTVITETTLIGDSPIRSGDVILVPQRHWFIRNIGIIATIIGASVSVLALLLR